LKKKQRKFTVQSQEQLLSKAVLAASSLITLCTSHPFRKNQTQELNFEEKKHVSQIG